MPWSFEDARGDNPRGVPGEFDFNVWYELGAWEDGEVPEFEIVGVTCTRVWFEGESWLVRLPTLEEREQLGDWFESYLASSAEEHEAVRNQAFEYSFVDSAPF